MNRTAVLLAGTTLLALTACGPARTGSLGPAPTAAPPSGTATPSPTATTGRPDPQAPPTGPSRQGTTSRGPDQDAGGRSGTLTVRVWFTRGGRIVPALRTGPATAATSRFALTHLVAGPSRTEASTGMGTAVPRGTTFTVVGVQAGVATVDFPRSFYAGGRDAARLRQAQVVYTLTHFPTVSRVGFRSGGEPTGAPVGRSDYADLLPRIVVTGPVPGQRVSSPITVAGTADVYEATVSLRVLDAAGRQLSTGFTTATCGSGCRGSFSTTISYRLAAEQRGTVEVYQVSAEDGSDVDLVRIPVVLAASTG